MKKYIIRCWWLIIIMTILCELVKGISPQNASAQHHTIIRAIDSRLNDIDFSEAALSDAVKFKKQLLGYVEFALSQQGTYNEKMAYLNRAVNNLLEQSTIHNRVLDFCTLYLLKGFRSLYLEEAVDMVLKQYRIVCSKSTCAPSDELGSLIASWHQIEAGQKAFNIEGWTKEGKKVSLYDIQSHYTLLLFWESDCPSCQIAMADLKERYQSLLSKEVTVVAFSLDNDATGWKTYVQTHELTWHSISDNLGGNSSAYDRYAISSTPCFFLLDDKKIIIYKPRHVKDLMRKLNLPF